jgi:hypothetical protein
MNPRRHIAFDMNATISTYEPAPLITTEQLALEEKAKELWEDPWVKGAMAKAKALMRAGYGIDVPLDMVARFDAAMDEYGFSYVERVLCRDRNNFCVHYTCHPPYERPDGTRVPGCRFYGENPDVAYRWGGIHFDRRQRLICKPVGPATTAASFALMGTYGGTTPGAAVDLDKLDRAPDGSFVITIDSTAADGRPNHLQTLPGTRLLLIREFLGDWATETPLAMTLEADGVTRGGGWDVEAALKDICFFMVEEVYLYFWMNHLYRNLEPNSVKGPEAASAMGGSASMATCQAFFQFAEDEAVIVQWDPAGAKLSGVSALDWWFQPIDAHRIQSSLNHVAAARNSDGTVTAVLAARDAGIVNWIDTGGFRDVLMTGRWQSLPPSAVRKGPRLETKLVKASELDAHLPSDIVRCSPDERRQRDARRLAAYTRRTGNSGSRFLTEGP